MAFRNPIGTDKKKKDSFSTESFFLYYYGVWITYPLTQNNSKWVFLKWHAPKGAEALTAHAA